MLRCEGLEGFTKWFRFSVQAFGPSSWVTDSARDLDVHWSPSDVPRWMDPSPGLKIMSADDESVS